jgi:hypothetical protein
MAAGTFTVDALGDGPDVIPGDGVCATAENFCTLRAAIVEANAIAGTDTIAFSVAGTISPSSDLPTILQRTTIDGTTAPDYAGAPVVVLDGGEVLSIGLNFGVTASASELVGMKIVGFAASGVNISASSMRVDHNHIGPIDGGTPNFDGIVVSGTDNQIGTGESAGNVISGNTNHGVVLDGSGHCLFARHIDGVEVFESATSIFIDEGNAPNTMIADAAPSQDEPIAETVVSASMDFIALTSALPPVKPAPVRRKRTLSRKPASPTIVASAPIVKAETAPKAAPSAPTVRPPVAAAPRPAPAQPLIAVSKPAPVREQSQPWNVPAVPVSPRSKLGLMFLAVGTAFAAFLRMIR